MQKIMQLIKLSLILILLFLDSYSTVTIDSLAPLLLLLDQNLGFLQTISLVLIQTWLIIHYFALTAFHFILIFI